MNVRQADSRILKQWRRDGFVHVPDLLDDDARARLGGWVDELAGSGDERLVRHHEMTDAGPVIARTEHFANVHVGLGALVNDGAITRSGAALLGEPITLYKEKVNYKLPGGAGFAAHQDATAYRFVDTHLTCMIAVDDATVENGCLELVAGCHHELLVDDGDGCLPASAEGALNWQPMEMRAGDVLWFHSRTPHRSRSNRSQQARRALFLTYNAVSEGDLRSAYYADKLSRLDGHGDEGRTRVSTIGHFLGRSVPDDGSSHTTNRPAVETDRLHTFEHEAMMTKPPALPMPWMELSSASDVADAIVDLYERRGRNNYDEAVTQVAHALQCGNHAMDNDASTHVIVAAFLHDLGHLLVDDPDGRDGFLDRDLHHEDVGARFLANWFGPAVTEPIRLHVPAKRYLCAVESTYAGGLSAASIRSLEVQGGAMGVDEIEQFRAIDQHEDAVELRRWDDWAKVPDASTPSLDTFRTLIESVVSMPTID